MKAPERKMRPSADTIYTYIIDRSSATPHHQSQGHRPKRRDKSLQNFAQSA